MTEDMRRNQHLITDDLMKYMAEYDVRRSSLLLIKYSSYHRPAGTPTLSADSCCDWRIGTLHGLPVASKCAQLPASCPLPSYDTSPSRLGHTISSAYIVTFQTHVFSVLPATFAAGFKRLLAATLELSTEGVTPEIPASVQDSRLWPSFELLGLADRYESLIASVCYEHIEKHVVETCAGKWDEPMLSPLREWMAEKVVPWMLLPYARGAKTGAWSVPSLPLFFCLTLVRFLSAEEARTMLQGVGSRFDFHVCKTLCDLR